MDPGGPKPDVAGTLWVLEEDPLTWAMTPLPLIKGCPHHSYPSVPLSFLPVPPFTSCSKEIWSSDPDLFSLLLFFCFYVFLHFLHGWVKLISLEARNFTLAFLKQTLSQISWPLKWCVTEKHKKRVEQGWGGGRSNIICSHAYYHFTEISPVLWERELPRIPSFTLPQCSPTPHHPGAWCIWKTEDTLRTFIYIFMK